MTDAAHPGPRPEASLERVEVPVLGMDCGGCVRTVRGDRSSPRRE